MSNYILLLCKKLKELRLKNGLTQSSLCNEIKKYGCIIDRSTYAKYESGKRIISLDVLIALALHYKVTTDFLLGL